jgi:group II intron reverse transcriptase/maturase
MTPDLERFTQMAHSNPKMKFNSLMGLVYRTAGLHDSFRRLEGNKAAGVDGMRKVDYSVGVEERLSELSLRLQRKAYTPKPVRRVYIPKINGGKRPLGIPSFEDRIVQDRVSQILQSIWEPEFCDCSYGFRPGRSAHVALRKIDEIIMKRNINYVFEADIKGFFQHVDHNWMLKFLAHRISDSRFLQLMARFLRNGVMEDGVVTQSIEGTPQGGLVSPILSNIYLHYVLDLWFEKRFRKTLRGEAYLVRYCDDFIVLFQDRADALSFEKALHERLAKFNLEVEPQKTRSLSFGIRQYWIARRVYRKTETFSFLGFTHYMGTSRRGRPMCKVKSDHKRIQKKLLELKDKLKSLRLLGHSLMVQFISQHLRGHFQYYGVSSNTPTLTRYRDRVLKLLFKWLNRCSQRRSMTWGNFMKLIEREKIPRVKIVHNFYKPIPL